MSDQLATKMPILAEEASAMDFILFKLKFHAYALMKKFDEALEGEANLPRERDDDRRRRASG